MRNRFLLGFGLTALAALFVIYAIPSDIVSADGSDAAVPIFFGQTETPDTEDMFLSTNGQLPIDGQLTCDIYTEDGTCEPDAVALMLWSRPDAVAVSMTFRSKTDDSLALKIGANRPDAVAKLCGANRPEIIHGGATNDLRETGLVAYL